MNIHHAIRLMLCATALLVAASIGPSVLADNGSLPMVEPESVGMSSERLERIGVGMRRLIEDDKIPGTVTLVARRGKVVHFEANGLRDVEAGLPMEHDTIFRLYSQSKVVTGAAVMLLFEEGALPDDRSGLEVSARVLRHGGVSRRGGRRTRHGASGGTRHHPAARHPHVGPDVQLLPDPRRADVPAARRGRDRHAVADPLGGRNHRPARDAQGMERTHSHDAARRPAGDRVALQRRDGRPRTPRGGRVRDELRRVSARAAVRTARHARHRLPRP